MKRHKVVPELLRGQWFANGPKLDKIFIGRILMDKFRQEVRRKNGGSIWQLKKRQRFHVHNAAVKVP